MPDVEMRALLDTGEDVFDFTEYALSDNEQDTVVEYPTEQLEKAYLKVAMMTLQGYTNSSIAEELGVKVNTIARWKKKDTYKDLARSLVVEIIDIAKGFLAGAGFKAVKILVESLNSPNERIRIQAAKEILDRIGLKTAEQLEVLTKSDDTDAMSTEELTAIVKQTAAALLESGDTDG